MLIRKLSKRIRIVSNCISNLSVLAGHESIEKAYELIKLNTQLSTLVRQTQYKEALSLFHKIHSFHYPNIKPDHYTLSTTLTACAHQRNIEFGNLLHAHVIKTSLKTYLHVANSLLFLYVKGQEIGSLKLVFDEIEYPDVYSYTTLLSGCVKFGDLGYAVKLFDEMSERDVAVWNAMITGCMEGGNWGYGFRLFRKMCRSGVRGDGYSFASVLSECDLEMMEFGRQVHGLVVKDGFLCWSSVFNALITMYFNVGGVLEACLLFKESSVLVRNRVSYNVMIDGLARVGRVGEALRLFWELLGNYGPTELSFVSFMSSCVYAKTGPQVHAQAIKMGLGKCTPVCNAAIKMYSSCRNLALAYMVFERLEEKDIVSWNTMISAFAQGNAGQSALLAYGDMRRAGIDPDEFTFGSLLAGSENLETAEIIHSVATKEGFVGYIEVSNALISAYSKHSSITQAYRAFYTMEFRNLISWNAVISGLLLNGLPVLGLEHFSKLLISGFRPNEYTISIVLSICAAISALQFGKQIHGYIMRHGFATEVSVSNSLIAMYSKCGILNWSLRIFNAMKRRDVVSWNAVISAYAQHGQGREALCCFMAMQNSSMIKPDQATFTAVLSACSHTGLVEDGTQIFNSMVDKYGITPGVDHFSCIIDLIGRAGKFDEMRKIMSNKHFADHPNIWWTILSACATHGNIELGRLATAVLFKTDHSNPSLYVLLSNIYTVMGRWEEATNIRRLMDTNSIMKEPGYSWTSL